MADENRRSGRISRNNQQISDDQGRHGSRQAEQFEDTDNYGQDSDSAGEWRGNQMGDQGTRGPVMYYEEVTWRSPSRGRGRDQRGGYGQRDVSDYDRNYDQGGRRGYGQDDRYSYGYDERGDTRQRGYSGRQGGEDRSYSRERDYGPSRYDNGLEYFTSESQDGRDFSRRGGRSYGARPGYGYGERSYGREAGYDRDYEGYDNRDRGFIERAGDEIASWFGDEDAARRRRMDHRGSGPANYKRSDERILEDINDCLTDDWQLDARNIEVSVNDGEVTLNGTVDHRNSKRRAEDLAEDISGVGHVQNNLRVKDRNAYSATDTES